MRKAGKLLSAVLATGGKEPRGYAWNIYSAFAAARPTLNLRPVNVNITTTVSNSPAF
jgi:hypothetical protein